MSKLFKILLGLCLIGAFAFGGIWGTRQLTQGEPDAGGERAAQAVRVGITAPQEIRVEDDVTGVGTLRAIRVVELMPVVAGRVTEVPATSGQTVSEGDVIVRLDDRAEQAALAEAEATLAETRSDFQRFEELGDSNAAAEARVEETRGAFLRAEAAVSSARAALEDRTITAPFDGTLGLLDLEPGSFPGQDATLTTLQDLSAVEIRLSLPERYFDRVAAGQTVTMQTPAYPDETFEGQVAVRAPQIDLTTRSFDVRARIPNPDGRLVGGMFANARLVFETYDALGIPDDAIISEGLTSFVYTVTDNTAARTEIVPGSSAGQLTEVRDGLSAEDRVVIAGWDDLSDGDTVEIDEDYGREVTN